MLKKFAFSLAFLPIVSFAGQNNIDFVNFDSQSQFKDFAKDLTGGLAMKTLEPAEPLGLVGFDIGLSYNLSSQKYKLMDHVSSNGKDSYEAVSVHATKGLPLGIDIGLTYSKLPGSNMETWGGKLSYAIIEGGALYPALGISGNYVQTSGLDEIDFTSYSAELNVSKGFAMFTPYAAVGMVNGEVKANATNQGAAGNLSKESVSMTKLAAGVNVNLLFMDVLVAYNQIGEVPTYSLKAGFRF